MTNEPRFVQVGDHLTTSGFSLHGEPAHHRQGQSPMHLSVGLTFHVTTEAWTHNNTTCVSHNQANHMPTPKEGPVAALSLFVS